MVGRGEQIKSLGILFGRRVYSSSVNKLIYRFYLQNIFAESLIVLMVNIFLQHKMLLQGT